MSDNPVLPADYVARLRTGWAWLVRQQRRGKKLMDDAIPYPWRWR